MKHEGNSSDNMKLYVVIAPIMKEPMIFSKGLLI